MSIKSVVKFTSRATIRTLSYLLPKVVLFRGSLLLRRFDLALKRIGAPPPVVKVADFLFYSLYSMRPALVVGRIWHQKFFIRMNDPCHYDLLLELHEPEVVEWLSTQLKKGMTFLDIGANIGFYTLLAAQRVGTSGTVVALEPDPDVVAVLRQNIDANALCNAHLVQGAAYRTCGNVRLGRSLASSWFSGLYYEKADGWIEVPAYALDSLVRELGVGRVDLVKLDVEGAEVEVLEGMHRILCEDRPKLLVELHQSSEAGDAHPVTNQLKKAGYSVRLLTERHVIAEPAEFRA